jgi:hypothetical protein
LFADAILGLELGEFVEDDRVYDLAPLQASNPPFQYSPESGIQSVAIKKFRLAINGTKERITLEANPEHCIPQRESMKCGRPASPISKLPAEDGTTYRPCWMISPDLSSPGGFVLP